MRLLVSVRTAAEVAPAVAGGADIIDAKDPSQGSLGAVSLAALAEIAQAVPPGVPFSIALGDVGDPGVAQHAASEALRAVGRRNEVFLKLGFAGTPDPDQVIRIALAGMATARRGGAGLVFVAYADAESAAAPSAEQIVTVAARAGADGLLLDTYRKDGHGLLHYYDAAALGRWVEEARASVGLVALAGSLDHDAIRRIRGLPADVVGVRGAACTGGRTGTVSEVRVRGLKETLPHLAFSRLRRIARSGA